MFNIYTYNKIQQEKEKKQKQKLQFEKYILRKKSNFIYINYYIENESKFLEGYKKRINSFIFHMISEPIKFNYGEENKNFCFRPKSPKYKENIKLKPFVQDKIRIEKFLKNKKKENDIINKKIGKKKHKNFNEEIDNSEIIEKNSFYSENKMKDQEQDKNNDKNYLQPIMKFKPRTDLERIFDTINLNYFGKIDKNLINEQLRSLGLLKVYNKKNPSNQNEYSLLKEKLKVDPQTLEYLIKEKTLLEQGQKTKEIYELIKNMDNIIQINKEINSEQRNKGFSSESLKKANRYKTRRKNLNNFLANNILGEYQKKTHFKALCTYSLDLEDKNIKEKKMERFNSLDNLDFNNNININNFKKKFKGNKKYSPFQMTYLKNLFLQDKIIDEKDELEKDKKSFEDESNRILRQQNNVLINGKYYNKKDIKGISNAILKKCNYIVKHFDVENAGNGKMMFTRGMTVNEFSKKFGLPK